MQKIGFIGTGMMASAMGMGIVQAKVLSAKDVLGADPFPGSQKSWSSKGLATAPDNLTIMRECDVIVISVKPDVVPLVLKEIAPACQPRHIVISIAAGVTIAALEAPLPPSTRVVRVMPNTPCLVGEVAAGFALGTNATAQDSKLVESLFASFGKAFALQEKLMDAVTGLSGTQACLCP